MSVNQMYDQLTRAMTPTGGLLFQYGTTKPSDAATGYAAGCLFFKTDGTTANDKIYINVGTEASANFDAISDVLGTLAIADGKIMVGNASGVGAAVDMSGDATSANDGEVTIAAGVVAESMLTTALADKVPYLAVSAADQTDGTADITIQLKDAAGNNLATKALVHCWLADTDGGAPAAPETTLDPSTGTVITTHTANADLDVISDANGTIVLVNTDENGTTYLMAEIMGVVYSAEVTVTGNA